MSVRFMMKVLELLMMKAELKKIMLTVFKHNEVGILVIFFVRYSSFLVLALESVFGICDMLARIRIRGSISLTNGSGSNSGSGSFLQ